MEIKLNLTAEEHKDLVSYCNLNDLVISSVVKSSYISGFNIERYGLLNFSNNKDKENYKEVIVEKKIEVPVEVVKEIVKIEYVEIQKPIEIIKEVPVERVVEKIVEVVKEVPVEKVVEVLKEVVVEKVGVGDLQLKIDALQNTVQKLKQDNIDKDKKIKEYEKTILEIQKYQQEKKAIFLRGSNLEDNLYK